MFIKNKRSYTASTEICPHGFAKLQREIATLQLTSERKIAQVKFHILKAKRLQKENRSLQKGSGLLSLDLLKEQQLNRKLHKKLKCRDRQIADLTQQLYIAKLPRNSSNSSRPPSTDLYKPPRNTNNSLRHKSGKKTGGQPGHVKSTLLFNTQIPDAVIRHSADFCEQCGNDLALASIEPEEVRQVVDIPIPCNVYRLSAIERPDIRHG